jgi:phosphatidylethanolamine/phosphatidyl-N-methylethanolamine N-methyltransferase
MSAGRAFWNRHATDYDRSMKLIGGPMPRMLELVADTARGAERALEIGSGSGLVTVAVAPVVGELLATDYAEAMVERTRSRVAAVGLTNVRCQQRDLYALGEPDGSYDVVIAANVLHLVPDLDGALATMRRLLRPGGRLVVPTFCHGETAVSRAVSWALSWVSFPAERRFDLSALTAAVERNGLAVDRQERISGVLPIGFVTAR